MTEVRDATLERDTLDAAPAAAEATVMCRRTWVGGWRWGSGARLRAIGERPLWDWGLHLPSDVWPLRQATKVLPVSREDMLPNLVRNPVALWRVGQLARRADLTRELEELKDRQLPVVVLWGARDGVVPRSAFDAMCTALGSEGEVIEGSPSWLR